MELDPNKIYLMPLIGGAIAEKKADLRPYLGEVEVLVLQYQTDYDALKPLIPDCFQLTKKPTVTVWFAYYNHVDFFNGNVNVGSFDGFALANAASVKPDGNQSVGFFWNFTAENSNDYFNKSGQSLRAEWLHLTLPKTAGGLGIRSGLWCQTFEADDPTGSDGPLGLENPGGRVPARGQDSGRVGRRDLPLFEAIGDSFPPTGGNRSLGGNSRFTFNTCRNRRK